MENLTHILGLTTMNEKITDKKNDKKNPYSYNGDVVNLTPPLTPQKNGVSNNEITDSQQVSENKFHNKKLYMESYGCQMNFSDSEIVASILQKEGYETTTSIEEADLVLLNTCSIREKAEQTVRTRLDQFNTLKKEKPELRIGVLGCMAERVKEKFFQEEKLVDLVVGPDAYRDLPNLLDEMDGGRKAVNVLLSKEETYHDIEPVRLGGNGVTAFVSITRGCDNMCTFCVVPFTRGRERSAIRRQSSKNAHSFGSRATRKSPYSAKMWTATSGMAVG